MEAKRETSPRPAYRGWVVPTTATLRKYGGTVELWQAVIDRQHAVCPVCEKVPSTGRGVIDHEHVKGWKAMPDAERWKFVRGVTCWFCNHAYLGRGITATKALNAARYLREHALRTLEGQSLMAYLHEENDE